MKAMESKPKAPAKFTYHEQHAVIIKVATERKQKELFEWLKKQGFTNLKVVSV
jgi:hypothetical protein